MSKDWTPNLRNQARRDLGDDDYHNLDVSTKLLASRLTDIKISSAVQPLVSPIYHTSVYKYESTEQFSHILKEGGYIYQRLGNPTVETAELLINEAEGGAGTMLYGSGLQACNALFLCFLKAGDHIVAQTPIYTGSEKFIKTILSKFGVLVTWVGSGCAISEIENAIRPSTTLIYAETPSNPTMTLTDLAALGQLGQSKKILTAVDGTFASPILQQPIKLGIDISIHSCTKYIGGHSDLIGGCLTARRVELWQALKQQTSATGGSMSPFDASLLIRGIKTLPIRMHRHSATALEIAQFLESHPKIVRVWYPGLPSHPHHELAKAQMSSFGGMISFACKDAKAAKTLVESVKIINLAVSLGGAESLIEHPFTMTHGPLFVSPGDEAVDEGLIRFSVGLEAADDLIADLKQALVKV